MPRNGDSGCCIVAWQCTSTYLPSTLLAPSGIWTLRCWSILLVVLIWSLWDTAYLVHSKMIFRGCLCLCNQQMKERVHEWLVSQSETLRVYRLVAQWTECVENKHDCVEKWCYCTNWNNAMVFKKQYILGTFWLTQMVVRGTESNASCFFMPLLSWACESFTQNHEIFLKP